MSTSGSAAVGDPIVLRGTVIGSPAGKIHDGVVVVDGEKISWVGSAADYVASTPRRRHSGTHRRGDHARLDRCPPATAPRVLVSRTPTPMERAARRRTIASTARPECWPAWSPHRAQIWCDKQRCSPIWSNAENFWVSTSRGRSSTASAAVPRIRRRSFPVIRICSKPCVTPRVGPCGP